MNLWIQIALTVGSLILLGFSDALQGDKYADRLKGAGYIVGSCAVSYGLFFAFIQ